MSITKMNLVGAKISWDNKRDPINCRVILNFETVERQKSCFGKPTLSISPFVRKVERDVLSYLKGKDDPKFKKELARQTKKALRKYVVGPGPFREVLVTCEERKQLQKLLDQNLVNIQVKEGCLGNWYLPDGEWCWKTSSLDEAIQQHKFISRVRRHKCDNTRSCASCTLIRRVSDILSPKCLMGITKTITIKFNGGENE